MAYDRALWGTWSTTTGRGISLPVRKMLVSDRGGAAAAADDVNDGGLSYGNHNDGVDDKE
jgi:hypothetical protein